MLSAFSRLTLILVAVLSLFIAVVKTIAAGSMIDLHWLVLLLGLAVASLLSLKLGPDVRFVVALCLILAGGGLVGLDYYVSQNIPVRMRDQLIGWWEAEGVDYDPRSKLEVIEDLRSDGVMAYPEILTRVLLKNTQPLRTRTGREVVPLSGMADRTIVYCNESGEWIVDVSDRHGFNNPPGLWSSPIIDLVAIGDSFTVGACVEPDKTLIAHIRARFPELLNLGRSGTAPLVQLAQLREYAQAMQPKLVLWFYYEGNDLLELEKERSHPILMRYLTEDAFNQGLGSIQPLINQHLDRYVQTSLRDQKSTNYFVGRDSRLVDILQLRNLRAIVTAGSRQTIDEAAIAEPAFFEEILRSANDAVHNWGGELVFVYLPGGDRYVSGAEVPRQYQLHHEVLQRVRNLNIPSVDLVEKFAEDPDPLHYFAARAALHYTVSGHKLVARTVIDYLDNSMPGVAPVRSNPH